MSQIIPKTIRINSHGIPIALSVWENNPHATTILFYPGTMCTPLLYTALLSELHRLGCNVVGIHHLSHGLSPLVKKTFVFDDIIQNGLDAEDWAKKHFSGPIVVCGHSQGGILALEHTVQSNDIAAAFPICTLLTHLKESGLVTRFNNYLEYQNLLIKFLELLSKYAPRLPLFILTYLELKRINHGCYKLKVPKGEQTNTYPVKFLHSLFSKDMSKACLDGYITCPVTLITAQNDLLFPLQFMQSTLDKISAPQKELCIIAGGGHLCALSKVYAKHIAAQITSRCAGFGLPLYIN